MCKLKVRGRTVKGRTPPTPLRGGAPATSQSQDWSTIAFTNPDGYTVYSSLAHVADGHLVTLTQESDMRGCGRLYKKGSMNL